MSAFRVAIWMSAFLALSCARGGVQQCQSLTRASALGMAKEAKAGMLRRSTDAYARNFASDEPAFVKVGVETNGYAANVGFEGRDGTTLVALIEFDCYIGWTEL